MSPVSCQSRSSSSCSTSRVIASSAPNGSSMRRTSASCASARARATRWRMPPDSSCGSLSPKLLRFTRSSSWSAFSVALGARELADLQRELDVAARGEPREQRRLLEHQRGAGVAGVDGARARAVEPGDDVEQRALAAAGRAEQAHELARRDVERDVVERVQRVALGAEDLRDVVDARPADATESSTGVLAEDSRRIGSCGVSGHSFGVGTVGSLAAFSALLRNDRS